MKKLIITTAFCLICLATAQFSIAAADTNRENGYISLNASKSVDVEPNIAQITFAIENNGETAQKAAATNNETSNKIINALKKITDDKTDTIKTSNFSVYPVYNTTKDGKRILKHYSAVNSITVQTKKVNNISNLIDTAINNGANRTDGLSYAFENENAKCNELYPIVMSELKHQAASLAQAAGTSIDGIKQINASCSTNSSFSNRQVFYAKAMSADAMIEENSLSTPIEAGKLKITVNINVNFYVK